MDYKNMALSELTQLPGVKDLQPLMARANFAKALKVEAEGNHEEAERLLVKAIEAEKTQ